MPACPTPELLSGLLSASLTAEEEARLRAHLEECAACRAVLDRATDAPDLTRWAGGVNTPSPYDAEAALARLVSHLAQSSEFFDSPVVRPPATLALGPPRVRGDLGTLGPYRIVREVGRGGLGVVFEGYDETLGRAVAIKRLYAERVDGENRRQLAREARHAARFRHDHVVVVYAVEETADGLPFIVMEYIPGPSVAELLRERTRLASRQAAELAAQAADGLAAAHQAGLIHRDIKPSNLLVDPATGRARIVDFGLAHIADAPGSIPEGTLVGTPSYMSPEQAGGSHRVDARTDQYSLGASLYEMLTGEPPFRGTPARVVHQILEDEPRPPRQLNEAIPRDLETICLKTLARDPRQRYSSAADLAADLRRWLGGEPIRARPAGRVERSYRWCRRNPRVAGLSAALLVVLAAGFAGVLWQWRRAERNALRAEILRREAEANLKQARAGFQQARRAVDQFYARFYEQGLLKIPGLEGVRHEVLEELLQYYKSFLAQHGDDPSLRRDVAEACARMGHLTFDFGNQEDALALLRRGLQEYDRLRAEKPDDRDVLDAIGYCLHGMGQLEGAVGAYAAAQRTYERGIQLLGELIRKDPDDLVHRHRLAGFHGNLAGLFLTQGDKGRARQAYRSALEVQKELVQRDPANLGFLNALGLTYNNLALAVDDPGEALDVLRQALGIRKEIVQRAPTNIYYLRNLARTHQNIGLFQSQLGKPDEALKSLEESARLMEQVVREQPAAATYQGDLAQALGNLGGEFATLGRHDDARDACERARTIYRKLLHGNPRDLVFQRGLEAVEQVLAGLAKDSQASQSRPGGGAPPEKDAGTDPRPNGR